MSSSLPSISSTIRSARWSWSGGRFRWTRTRRVQSAMIASLDDAAHGGRERFPLLALLLECLGPGFGQVVVAAAAFARALDPAPGDETAVLQAVEDGVESGDAEGEL